MNPVLRSFVESCRYDRGSLDSVTFIATGTGITPFRSAIHHLLEEGFQNPITLLAGYRYEKNSLYDKEFKELVDSDKWSCIVVDDITKKEFDKRIKKYTPDG